MSNMTVSCFYETDQEIEKLADGQQTTSQEKSHVTTDLT